MDQHYFRVNARAMRRILANRPPRHVNVDSQTVLASLLSVVVAVIDVDYRRLVVSLDNLRCVRGNILELPFGDCSVASLPWLHFTEHSGLGPYGDPLYPEGRRKAARELARVLAPGGNLFFAIPVGRPHFCFNAHRLLAARRICEYLSGSEVIEYSAVDGDGRFVQRAVLEEFQDM